MSDVRMTLGAQVLLRPGNRIQFGVDPKRALVFQLPDAVAPGQVLKALLDDLRVFPRPDMPLATALTTSGLERHTVQQLLVDLVAAGLARHGDYPQWPTVAVIGAGVLRDRLVDAIIAKGGAATARAPGSRTATWLQRSGTSKAQLVVLAGLAVPDVALLQLLRRVGMPHVSARLRDGRGVLGPWVTHDGAACPACAERHLEDADPARPLLSLQLRSAQPSARCEVIDATIATLLTHLGDGRALRGVEVEVDPVGLAPGVRAITPHRHCPVCTM
ncbi:hypothetical protein KRX51_02785 [Corynebacterium sp. TAE3-ERU12]|uniref:hypothetical protein n=1 Tax=Corynebacterium sp. TAE3-ERU12 TaxID=2849491 RepID=UPI001C495626|nr:hypothetical protein [Corynebacterium sp. TAE3-ERU12]MBV7294848.1 hypothetical protein [Corynebacterium sp. TAE3-ERU12]